MSEDENLNGCSIIQDLLEIKEYYQRFCQKKHVEKILEFAFSEEPHVESQNAALAVLNSLCRWHVEKHSTDVLDNR